MLYFNDELLAWVIVAAAAGIAIMAAVMLLRIRSRARASYQEARQDAEQLGNQLLEWVELNKSEGRRSNSSRRRRPVA
jgi:hypothetical protein